MSCASSSLENFTMFYEEEGKGEKGELIGMKVGFEVYIKRRSGKHIHKNN